MNGRTAYYCGSWIAESDVTIPVGDLGFTMGVTVTERLRTFDGRLFRKQQHLARLRNSLNVVGLDADRIVSEIDGAMEEYLKRHREQMVSGDDWAVIAFATPGSGGEPTVCVHGMPLPFADWADVFDRGVVTYLSQHRQTPPSCWPAELKCRSRMHYYLANLDAQRRDPKARAILLDQEGFVGEESTANLVTYHSERGLATPKSTKVLPGVSVAVIAELAAQLNLPFAERDISLDEFQAADEIWITSTSICMLPLVQFEGSAIGSGQPGPLFARLLASWNDLVGTDIAAQARQFAVR